MQAISLIYGEHVVDDLEFCCKYEEVIDRYSHGIMTLQGSPLGMLKAIALDPKEISGWAHLLENHPQDCAVLQDFLERLIRQKTKLAE